MAGSKNNVTGGTPGSDKNGPQRGNVTAALANAVEQLVTETCQQMSSGLLADLTTTRSELIKLAAEQKDVLIHLSSKLIELQGRFGQVSSTQEQLTYSQQTQEKQFSGLLQQMNLLENVSHENHLLGERHYQEHIVEPMIHSVFPIFDMIADGRSWGPAKDSLSASPAYELIDMVETCLRQFLSTYQVTLIQHEPRSMFEPRLMKPLKLVPTDRRKLDGRIAKCLQVGFVYKQETVLRPESVALYRYADPDRREDPNI